MTAVRLLWAGMRVPWFGFWATSVVEWVRFSDVSDPPRVKFRLRFAGDRAGALQFRSRKGAVMTEEVITKVVGGDRPDRAAWVIDLSPSTVEIPGGYQVFDANSLSGKGHALARSEDLGGYIIRFRAGRGEVGLHAHAGDSMWMVLDGAVKFWNQDSLLGELKQNQGVLIPSGAPYRYECAVDSILMRFSVAVPDPGPQEIAESIPIVEQS